MKHKKAIYPFICAPKCSASPKNDLFLQGNAVVMPGQETVIFEPKKGAKNMEIRFSFIPNELQKSIQWLINHYNF